MTETPHCAYCGSLGWTLRRYGRVTHKLGCPNRTNVWSQTYPYIAADPVDAWARVRDLRDEVAAGGVGSYDFEMQLGSRVRALIEEWERA